MKDQAMNDKPCGCNVVYERYDMPNTYRGRSRIDYCPMHKAAPEMVAALEDVMAMIDQGLLVRNITKDADPKWAIEMMKFAMRLNKIQAALALAGEGET